MPFNPSKKTWMSKVCASTTNCFSPLNAKMVADFNGVDERTIKRYVQEHGDELRANGYFFSEGNSLKAY